jgi:hypothetical protein
MIKYITKTSTIGCRRDFNVERSDPPGVKAEFNYQQGNEGIGRSVVKLPKRRQWN